MLTSKIIKYQIVIFSIFTFSFNGLLYSQNTQTIDEKRLQLEIGEFKGRLYSILKEDILKEITASDSKYRLTQLDNWPKVSSFNTLQVEYSGADNPDRKISVRLEQDFIVIWYHNSTSFVKDKSNSSDVIRNTINDILKPELENLPSPKEVTETNAITVRFGTGSISKKESNHWNYIDSRFANFSVLVKDNDAVIVIERRGARARESYYEGLLAAKTRLSERDNEKFKNKLVLARNVIFDDKTNIKDIPDRLLNGCMWPIDDDNLVGVKDIGPVTQLRLESMSSTN